MLILFLAFDFCRFGDVDMVCTEFVNASVQG